MLNENEKVKLKHPDGSILELPFDHARELLRLKASQNRNNLEVIGNHEFKGNELIIKPSTRSGKKSTKPTTGKKGKGLPEPIEDLDGGLQ